MIPVKMRQPKASGQLKNHKKSSLGTNLSNCNERYHLTIRLLQWTKSNEIRQLL
jgi:hypothetical protein